MRSLIKQKQVAGLAVLPAWRTLLDNIRSIPLKSSLPLAFTDGKAAAQKLCYDAVLPWKGVQFLGL